MEDDGSTVLFRALPEQIKSSAAEKRALKRFAQTLTSRVLENREFTCLISDDRELRALNRAFRGHDCATDVLSFPAASIVRLRGGLGEIAISAERADLQARKFGHSRTKELQILMLHGVLHLAGMDHERDAGEMAREERKWRAEFSLPMTVIARAVGSKFTASE